MTPSQAHNYSSNSFVSILDLKTGGSWFNARSINFFRIEQNTQWKLWIPPSTLTNVSTMPVTSEKKLCGIPLTLSQTTNFRLFQNERVCRRQFHV